MDSKNYLKKLYSRTLDACSPGQAITKAVNLTDGRLAIKGTEYLPEDRPIYLFASGKAAVPMSKSIEQILGEKLTAGLVIAPDTSDMSDGLSSELVFGSHPFPDSVSVEAGRRLTDFVQTIPAGALVLSLISGGTSSLVCLPADGISTDDIQFVYKLLIRSGATIRQINAVRKHCSEIKGGGLLQMFSADITLIDLIISDVPGNDPAIIGSGLTTPDESTFQDAYDILAEYSLWDQLPRSVQHHIRKGVDGEVADTLEPAAEPLSHHDSFIISSAEQFADEAMELARHDGYRCVVAEQPFNDDVETVAAGILEKVRSEIGTKSKPQFFFFYGESTVKVRGEGKGGRNQELALHGALQIAGGGHISWLSAGTDGIDGPTDAAGAIVDNRTIPKARKKEISPETYLENNDSYHFHQQMDTLLQTGATGNNLMDVAWVLVDIEG